MYGYLIMKGCSLNTKETKQNTTNNTPFKTSVNSSYIINSTQRQCYVNLIYRPWMPPMLATPKCYTYIFKNPEAMFTLKM